MRLAILAHDRFPHAAKTAIGVMRYGEQEVTAVIDRALAGTNVRAHTDMVPDAPIVQGFEDVSDVDALLIGVSPIGGGFDESWRPDVCEALERGCDVIAGLHVFLSDDPEFTEIADRTGATIRDVRRPPADLGVSEGRADEVSARVILTVGTDCSVGKMTATFELVEALRERGYDAATVPTGQTGIMIEGWGYPVDRIISDFVAGAVEDLVLERGDEHDVLIVEGQGSITHPAYSAVTCGILHGAMPDALVLCHEADREAIGSYERFSIPPLDACADLYERLSKPVSDASVVAGVLNTAPLEDTGVAEARVADASRTLGVPVTDPIRFGSEPVLDALR